MSQQYKKIQIAKKLQQSKVHTVQCAISLYNVISHRCKNSHDLLLYPFSGPSPADEVHIQFSVIMTSFWHLHRCRYINQRENKRRDKDDDDVITKNIEFMDLTDRENQKFRYVL